MRKLSAFLMSLILVFSLTACGSDGQDNDAAQKPASKPTSEAADAETENPEGTSEPSSADAVEGTLDTESASGKTLVVYYSASGNTKEVADYIAEATQGDVFELEPVKPYTDEDLDWTDDDSRVCKEHENEDERDVELVSTKVDNWDSYETVFIGYPIWWGIAAWPVDGFIKANDFSGKTVIPFCTSSSSGLGRSGELLEELAGTGNWLEGNRFRSGASKEDVRSWVEGLKL